MRVDPVLAMGKGSRAKEIGVRVVRDDAERGCARWNGISPGRSSWWFHTDWVVADQSKQAGQNDDNGSESRESECEGGNIYTKNHDDSSLTSPPKSKRAEFESQTNEGTFKNPG